MAPGPPAGTCGRAMGAARTPDTGDTRNTGQAKPPRDAGPANHPVLDLALGHARAPCCRHDDRLPGDDAPGGPVLRCYIEYIARRAYYTQLPWNFLSSSLEEQGDVRVRTGPASRLP